jgi:hypothetical protein
VVPGPEGLVTDPPHLGEANRTAKTGILRNFSGQVGFYIIDDLWIESRL